MTGPERQSNDRQPRWPQWFSNVTAATTAVLAAEAARQSFPRGSILFVEGDPAHHVLVVQRGDIKLAVVAASGREVVLDVIAAIDIIGDVAAMDGGPRSATATALTPVTALAIPSTRFRDIAHEHPDLLAALFNEVLRRLRVSDRRQLEFGGDALGKVCARLIEIADRQGTSTTLVLPVSQAELADWTGLSRESVVKALAALRSLGWLTTDGRRFELRQLDEIRTRATI